MDRMTFKEINVMNLLFTRILSVSSKVFCKWAQLQIVKDNALTGNRTRVTRMASEYSATKPWVHNVGSTDRKWSLWQLQLTMRLWYLVWYGLLVEEGTLEAILAVPNRFTLNDHFIQTKIYTPEFRRIGFLNFDADLVEDIKNSIVPTCSIQN